MRVGPVTPGEVRRAKDQAVGGGRKRCRRGKNCSATCISGNKWCLVDLPEPAQIATTKIRDYLKGKVIFKNPEVRNAQGAAGGAAQAPANYSQWNPVAQGNYGKVSISPDGTRAVKELLTGKDGKKGEFGPHEVEIAKKMGDLGHSPKIHRATPEALEMDVAKGKPLWEGYRKTEEEPRMNAEQATKAGAAIQALHKMGYAHGDMHSQQFLVNGNDVKLVDYGLSVPHAQQPVKVMQDLSKINGLVDWKNPEMAGNPYFQLVNKYLDPYKEIKGTSQAAKNQKAALGEAYLKELEQLQ